MELDIVVWLMGAIIVVGLVEWAKALLAAVTRRTWKAIVLVVLLPIAAFVAGLSMDGGSVWVALGIWSIAQIGYELIIKTVTKKLGGE